MKNTVVKAMLSLMLHSSIIILPNVQGLWAQDAEEEGEGLFGEEPGEFEEEDEENRAAREEEARLKKEKLRKEKAAAEEKKKREQIRKAVLKQNAIREEQLSLSEAGADTTEYTINPDSVQIVVEMDPNGAGFRDRTHRMTMTLESDFILRGSVNVRSDYRFFKYFSVGVLGGINWTDLSLASRFGRELNFGRPPTQFAVLGGVFGKLRSTEWILNTSMFIEPTFSVGRMWQTLASDQKTTHWRLQPGISGGFETVFDSGFVFNTRLGVEFPVDFGQGNAWPNRPEPLLALGFGFAI